MQALSTVAVNFYSKKHRLNAPLAETCYLVRFKLTLISRRHIVEVFLRNGLLSPRKLPINSTFPFPPFFPPHSTHAKQAISTRSGDILSTEKWLSFQDQRLIVYYLLRSSSERMKIKPWRSYWQHHGTGEPCETGMRPFTRSGPGSSKDTQVLPRIKLNF